jgi:hypothetical protein
VHNRDPRELPLVSGGATVVGNGVLATAADDNVVFCQLAPWHLDYAGGKMNIKRTFRKLSYCTTRILANMGAAGRTPLLEQVSRPVVIPVDLMADFRGTMRIEHGDRALPLPLQWRGLPLADGAAPKGWAEPGFDPVGWRAVRVLDAWEQQYDDLVDFDGTFLYRVTVTVPQEIAEGESVLVLGAIDDEDHTWLNGRPVGSITRETNPADYWRAVRSYRLPAGTLVAGENVIAVQVEDVHQAGGIMGFATVPDVPVLDTEPETRWLSGLYLDVPEEWDDPYRFFRW